MKESTGVSKTVICHDCGQILSLPAMPDKTVATCPRCSARLFRQSSETIDRTLALAFTGLILFIIANVYPFLGMRIEGFIHETSLITGIIQLFQNGMPGLATLVFITIFVVPAIQLLGLIYICLPLRFGRLAWGTARLFRLLHHLQPWGMIEVYMLGILISMIKLAKMASIITGTASWAFMALIFVLAAAFSGLNPSDVWNRIPIKKKSAEEGCQKGSRLISCHSCSFVCQVPDLENHYVCPRCQAPLHFRKTNSIQRTWALLIAAAVFYIPANLFPITLTGALGHEQTDTILSGVIYFMFSGSWHIAIVIFMASIVIPLLKIMILIFLLVSVQKKSRWKPEDRTRLYRITEAVGRWSMVDVFVVTILIALVQLGPMASVRPAPGVIYFASVVVITMFAAENFDPRLIWDAMEESE